MKKIVMYLLCLMRYWYICRFVCLFIYLFVCLFVCLNVYPYVSGHIVKLRTSKFCQIVIINTNSENYVCLEVLFVCFCFALKKDVSAYCLFQMLFYELLCISVTK